MSEGRDKFVLLNTKYSFRAAVRALIAVCETDSSIVSLLADKFKYGFFKKFVY